MKFNLTKNGLIFLVIILFVLSSVLPVVFGNESRFKEDDMELENLAFICREPNGFNSVKYDYYKQQLISQRSSEDNYCDVVVEPETTIVQIESKVTPLSFGPMDSAWPMKCHDTHHTGRSLYSTADTCAEKWRFSCDWVEGGSVIGDDGTIYFGDFDDYLYALYPNGTIKWKYKTGGWIWSTPTISEDGTIYIGSWDDHLYAINPNGTLKWRFLAHDDIYSSPAIAEDGTIYFGTMLSGNNIYAVSPNGTEKWHYTTGNAITSDPAIGNDGTVYIGSQDNYLYALYPNGTLRWRFKTGKYIMGPPSIADDNTIYIASWDNHLYALYPNGTKKWKYPIGVGAAINPSIASDGTIYVGHDALYAINPDGTQKWTFSLGTERLIYGSSPAISADGIVYIGTEIGEGNGGEIIAINPNGTEKWRKKIAEAWIESSPSIAEDGTVYIGTTEGVGKGGYLYAFGVGELEAYAHGPYYGLTNQPVQFTGSHWGGYSPHSYHWDFGDTHTSEEQNPTHIYTVPGNYTVILTVTDNTSNTSSDTTWAWVQETNTPPDKPTITGETNGKTGESYDYTFTATDPDESIIWYYIDWGDNTNTGWLGPFNNGQTITKSHKWTSKGTYNISCKAKDPYGEEGPWGELKVTMPKNKMVINTPFLKFLRQHSHISPILRQLLGL